MINTISKILSPQLILREYTVFDAEELIEILKPNIDHMWPWIPWAKDEPESLEDKQNRIRMWNNNHLKNTDYYTYGIFTRAEEKMIGTVYLFTRRGKGILEIGYWIDKNQTGKGYATECSYAVTKLAFEYINIEKMKIHCDVENAASSKIPEKLSYHNEFDYKVLEKDDKGHRRIFKAWVLFREEFKTNSRYEPVIFFDKN